MLYSDYSSTFYKLIIEQKQGVNVFETISLYLEIDPSTEYNNFIDVHRYVWYFHSSFSILDIIIFFFYHIIFNQIKRNSKNLLGQQIFQISLSIFKVLSQ